MIVISDPKKRKQVLDAYQTYFDAYTKRDWAKMTSVFSEGFAMYGTGIDETSFDKESSLRLFKREFDQAPDMISYQVKTTEVFEVTEDVALIMMIMDLQFLSRGHVVDTMDNRTTAVMKQWDDGWKLVHAHWSQPDSIQDVGESVPYKKLVQKTHELEKLVKARTREIEEQNLDLKQLNDTKTKLFSIIAHDLRNPFNSILGFTELLIQRIHELDREKTLQYLHNIHSQASNTYRMLENLLEWARAQTGEITPDMQVVNLHELAGEVIHGLQSAAEAKRLSLKNLVPEEAFCLADPHLMHIILGNLLANALKYTCPGGHIEIGANPASGYIEVHVTDNGLGMPDELQSRLFDTEINESTPGTEKEKGSGLGLMLCKEFVEKQGGRIWVSSSLKEGSRFSFTVRKARD